MKKIFINYKNYTMAFLAIVMITVIGVNIQIAKKGQNGFSDVTLKNIEALTQETNWSNLRLKIVDCTCPSLKGGVSLQCRDSGELEHCSITQQGSNGCYKISVFTSMNLLCEGAGITYKD